MTHLRHGITIAIPARNEEGTIGQVVQRLASHLNATSVVDAEILVVDDRSTDETAQIACESGARVVRTSDICSTSSGSAGKGDAIWAAVHQCNTTLIGFVDADLTALDPALIMTMFRPLQLDPNVQLVKGVLTRVDGDTATGPGRVTALTAQPLLSILRPDVSSFSDPLSGLFAVRTETIGALWLDCDYGVDVGVLIDVVDRFGHDAVVELNVGQISHRRRPLEQLTTTATQVARAIIARAHETNVPSDDLLRRRPPARAARRRVHAFQLRSRH